MKRSKLLLSGIAVLAIVGSSLAFKASTFADASVYCESTCTTKANFRVDPSGTTTNPCLGAQPYVLTGTNPTICTATATGTKFTTVINAGK